MAFPFDRGRKQCFQSWEWSLAKHQWQHHYPPADLDGRSLGGQSWVCFGWLDLLSHNCHMVRAGQVVGHAWAFHQSNCTCNSYLDWIISKHQCLALQKLFFFKLWFFYVAFFLAKLIKGFGYISLHFNVCILFYTALITKLLCWTYAINTWWATKLFWKTRNTVKIYTNKDIP